MSDRSANPHRPTGGRWFISAPAEVNLGPLLADLQRRGADPYVLSDVAPLGANLLQSIQQAIAQADHVLVVLTAGHSTNSAFEAGVAAGLGKSLVIVAEPDVPLPTDLAGFLTVRAGVEDLDAINFALDHAEQRQASSAQYSAATSIALGTRADPLIERAVSLLNLSSPMAVEREAIDVLLQAVETSGAVTALGPRGTDAGFDAAVWLDDLEAIAANPLLIELKRSFHVRAVQQVLKALELTPSARVALIVYLDPASATQAGLQAARFPVLAISLVELLERMRANSFAEVVRDLRNRSVHGLPPS